jgi:protoporphyrinogen oxidase
MKIGIIGAGFTGLTAGYDLAKAGHKVQVFETYGNVGGLAGCEDINGYPLERCYHHLFESDKTMRKLVSELGLSSKLRFKKTADAVYYQGKTYPLSSPSDVLTFSPLSASARMRLAATSTFLKLYPNWQNLEGKTAKDWLIRWAGSEVYQKLWEPLLVGKFGKNHADKIAASWFWARIKARTFKLGYFEDGFETVAKKLAEKIKKKDGQIHLKEPVFAIEKKDKKIKLTTAQGEYLLDKVIFSAAISFFPKIVKNLNKKYSYKLEKFKFLHAQCLVLIIKKSLSNYYWLNIADTKFPFLLTVEQTNFVPSSNYGGQKILYIGNYLEEEDPRWRMPKDQLLKLFFPYFKKINSKFSKKDIKEVFLFRGAFAQPIVDINYSKNIPSLATPIKNLYLATMAQVYPYDRGTNYAVSLGHQVANLILGKSKIEKAKF